MNQTQEEAVELALEGHNIFLTGQIGTGKTHCLIAIAHSLRQMGKKVVCTASTGIASKELKGINYKSYKMCFCFAFFICWFIVASAIRPIADLCVLPSYFLQSGI